MRFERLTVLNMIFMLGATAVAYLMPFELLLFSYAVLGPAHYLTEISWLHDRNYFTSGSQDYLVLVVLTLFLLYVPVPTIANSLVFASFAAALVMVLKITPWHKSLIITFSAVTLAMVLRHVQQTALLAQMLVTIVHVYLFTGCFILFGALKRKNVGDIVSVLLFVVCGLSFFVVTPHTSLSSLSTYTLGSSSYFQRIASDFRTLLRLEHGDGTLSAVMGFFAFAYTYHYLNWFSKTKIIGWHAISKLRLGSIVFIYLVSIGLYVYDYQRGFSWLLLLSLLHVVLEFPLNHRTFWGIGLEVGKLLKLNRSA